MPSNTKLPSSTELKGPAREFIAYCESEMERLRNSGEPFDESLYQEAMKLVLAKLAETGEGTNG